MDELKHLNRRDFLKLTGLSATGFVLGLQLPSKSMATPSSGYHPNLFIHIPTKGPIEIVCHRSEMGQGIRTSLTQMIADELEAPLDQVKIIQALGDKKYGDQNTDGSRSIKFNWTRLREMSSVARETLVQVAAEEWKVSPKTCQAKLGKVFYSKGKKEITYQDLASKASQFKGKVKATLKKESEFRYIKKDISGLDVKDYVTGKAVYGMDAKVDEMVHMALKRAPLQSGKVKSFDKKKALKVPGVLDIIQIEAIPQAVNVPNAVGVIATNSWSAFQGAEALEVKWDIPKKDLISDKEMWELYRKEMDAKRPGKVFREVGKDLPNNKIVNRKTYEYTIPNLSHAQMEPMVALAYVQRNKCEVWAPTQDPQRARKAIAGFLKIPTENVFINVTFLGGGFGRKSQPDSILEAVAGSKKLGKPVKVVWTREDDMKNGFYQPASLQRIEVGFDQKGNIYSWDHKTVFSSLMSVFMPSNKHLADWEVGMGATVLPYHFPKITVSGSNVDLPFRRGWLRSVHNIYHSFAISSTLDEIAQDKKLDPLKFNLDMLGPDHKIENKAWGVQETGRLKKVINEVRSLSNWDKKQKQGKKLGFSALYSFFSYLAFVVELEDKIPKGEKFPPIKNVYCIIDCGEYVSPNYIKAQMEGSVIFGMSIVYYNKISLGSEGIQQSNFDDYELVRIEESPNVVTKIMDNNHPPAGVGEPAVPTFLGALTNAISRATGKRIRELPIKA